MEENTITAAAVKAQSFEDHSFSCTLPWHCRAKEAPCDSEEHRSQQWTRGVARTERHILRQQQRSPTSADKRSETILQTTDAVERSECDVKEHEQKFGKPVDEDVKIGVIVALAPPQVQDHCHLNSHILKSDAQVRTMLFDYCRAQADTATGDVQLGAT